jgi:DNA-binding beta-propeller fold protein YncE
VSPTPKRNRSLAPRSGGLVRTLGAGSRVRIGLVAALLCLVCLVLLLIPGRTFGFGPIGGFGVTGSGAGQLAYPTGIAIAPGGRIYVVDYENNRVSVYSPGGDFVQAFGKAVNPSGGNLCTAATGCQKGVADASAGALWGPISIAIDSAGAVYLTDANSYRVDVFSADGGFIRAFGKGVNPAGGNVCSAATGCQKGTADYSAGSLVLPLGIALDSAGLLYVTSVSNRIDVFSRDGTFIRGFGKGVNPAGGDVCTAASGCQQGKEPASAGGMSLPYGIAVSPSGLVAASDFGNRRIDVFDTGGTFVRAFGKGVNPATDTSTYGVCTAATGCRAGTEGTGAGAVTSPVGMAFDPQGHMLAADYANHRVSEFAGDGGFIRAFGEGVVNGEAVFQVCTTAIGCRAGLAGTGTGSLPHAFGVTTDCLGTVYVTAWSQGGSAVQVKRFGEPGTADPPCVASAPPSPSPSGDFLSSGAGRPTTAKPSIKVELNKGSGTANLVVIVSDPGTLLLKGKGIRKVKRQAKRPGLIELLVAPKGAMRRKLEETGKAAVKLSLTFNAYNGASNTQTKAVGLKMVAPL